MDPSLLAKFKEQAAAFFAGAVAFSIATWFATDGLHTREIAVLEREKGELQRRLSEAETKLKQQDDLIRTAEASVKSLTANGRQELEILIRTIDVEIASKKKELNLNSPLSYGDPPSESYRRIEAELRSLQEQRDQARKRLIQTVVE